MNNIVLAGRLTKAPELKTTNSGVDVLPFTMAVNRAYAKSNDEVTADFIPCIAWRKTATFISKYFNKGDGIVIKGRLETRKWVDNNGNNRVSYEVIVENTEFPQGKSKNNTTATNTPIPSMADDLPVDDDLPF
nr:MAG TPA: Single strand binding protein [Caudoviricetes sp.]